MFAAWGCRHNVCPSAGAGSGPILSSPGQFTATTQPGPPRGHQALAKRDADAPFREYGLRRVTSRFRCTILAAANAHAHRPHGATPDRLKPLVSELLDAECSEALLVALGAGPPRRGEPARRPETLSAREVEVLALVAQGLNYGGRPGISRKRDTASPAVPLLPVIGITPWCFSEILQPGTERKRKSPPARAAKGEKTGPGSAIQAAQRLVWGACGRVRTVKCTVQAFQSGRSGHPAGVFFIIFPRWSTKKSRNTPPGRGFTHGRNLLIRHRLNLRPQHEPGG